MKMRKTVILLYTLVSVFLLTACSSRSGSYNDFGAYGNKAYYGDTKTEELAYSEPTQETGIDNLDSLNNEYLKNQGRKLITTIDITLETKSFNDTLSVIEEKIKEVDGYFEKREIRGEGSAYLYERTPYKTAYLVLRIPSDKLAGFVTALGEQANIVYRLENTTDVTLEYVDIESRKKSLEIEQERLWKLLEQADNIETIIALETRLSQVRLDIERYTSDLKAFDNKVEYSTLHIDLSEVRDYTPDVKITVGERISTGFKRTLTLISDIGVDLFVYLIVLSPILILIALIILFIIFITRLIIFFNKKKKIKEKTAAAKKEADNGNLISEPKKEQCSDESK